MDPLIWPFDSIIPDFSFIKAYLIGALVMLAGIAAIIGMPGKLFKIIAGGGLMLLGYAIIQGWIII